MRFFFSPAPLLIRSQSRAGKSLLSKFTRRSSTTYRFLATPALFKPKTPYLSVRLGRQYGSTTDEQPNNLSRLVDRIESGDHGKVAQIYSSFMEKDLLQPTHIEQIAQLLHAGVRINPANARHRVRYAPVVDIMLEDYRANRIAHSPIASMHLISTLKELKDYKSANDLFVWLEGKGDEYIDSACYGAAIENLSFQHTIPFENLEKLYIKALERFPGTFAEYHVSNNAIVPDRAHRLSLPGLPVALMQGLLTARMHYKDWKGAYLVLDTVLRLIPDQTPERFFELSMHERPIAEAFTIFQIACRSGVVPKPDRLTYLLGRLRRVKCSIGEGNEQNKDHELKLNLNMVTAMFNSILAYIGVGGTPAGPHLSNLVLGLNSLIPREGDTEEKAKIRESIPKKLKEMLVSFAKEDVVREASPFNALISVAAHTSCPDIVHSMLGEMRELGVRPTEVTMRSLVNSVAHLDEPDRFEASWLSLVEVAKEQQRPLEARDWLALARTGRKINNVDFVNDQVSKMGSKVTKDMKDTVDRALLDTKYQKMPSTLGETDWSSLHLRVRDLFSLVGPMLQLAKSRTLHNFDAVPIPVSLLGQEHCFTDNETLRTVYDKLTTDPSQPTPASNRGPDISPTSIPFDKLRYENWKSINELLSLVDTCTSEKEELATLTQRHGIDAASLALFVQRSLPSRLTTEDELMREICRLRNLSKVDN